MKLKFGSVFLAILLTLACSVSTPALASTLPFLNSVDFTPYWPKEGNTEANHPAELIPFHLKTQSGQMLTEADFKGHISVVNFFFAECGTVCPRFMSRIQVVQKKTSGAPGVRFYSFSVLPKDDTPAALRTYARNHRLNLKNWDLVTGERDELYRIGRKVFKADERPTAEKSDDNFIHNENVYLLDGESRIRGIYNGSAPKSLELLTQDIERLSRSDNR
jgi:protein SCO1/2